MTDRFEEMARELRDKLVFEDDEIVCIAAALRSVDAQGFQVGIMAAVTRLRKRQFRRHGTREELIRELLATNVELERALKEESR